MLIILLEIFTLIREINQSWDKCTVIIGLYS
jgi:hypothetical protein